MEFRAPTECDVERERVGEWRQKLRQIVRKASYLPATTGWMNVPAIRTFPRVTEDSDFYYPTDIEPDRLQSIM